MTRPETVRFLRTQATMAFPEGRLLALRAGQLNLLAPDGWTRLRGERPSGSTWLTREEAEDWCEREGWPLHLLNEVPRPGRV